MPAPSPAQGRRQAEADGAEGRASARRSGQVGAAAARRRSGSWRRRVALADSGAALPTGSGAARQPTGGQREEHQEVEGHHQVVGGDAGGEQVAGAQVHRLGGARRSSSSRRCRWRRRCRPASSPPRPGAPAWKATTVPSTVPTRADDEGQQRGPGLAQDAPQVGPEQQQRDGQRHQVRPDHVVGRRRRPGSRRGWRARRWSRWRSPHPESFAPQRASLGPDPEGGGAEQHRQQGPVIIRRQHADRLTPVFLRGWGIAPARKPQVAGRPIPQPGGFYGGWITSDVVGPFKGGPGSWDW